MQIDQPESCSDSPRSKLSALSALVEAVAAAELLSFHRRPMSIARLGQEPSKTTSDLCASLSIPPAIPKNWESDEVFIPLYYKLPVSCESRPVKVNS